MYSKEYLGNLEALTGLDLDNPLDGLTGLLSRNITTKIIKNLINSNIPFYLFMIDIDNFKFVNDTFGHQAGDLILEECASDLIKAIGESGLVGRYGGDEFLVIVTDKKLLNYNSIWTLLKEYFDKYLRFKVYQEFNDLKITVTVGASQFPEDAKNYDDLLLMVDKALYRGKQKGRNCYIIYNPLKHANIDLTFLNTNQVFTGVMSDIYDIMINREESLHTRIDHSINTIERYFSISGAVIQNDEIEIVSSSLTRHIPYELIKSLKDEVNHCDMLVVNDYSTFIDKNPNLHKYCAENKIRSFVVLKIYNYKNIYGYLTFYDNERKRIWQADNQLLFKYFSNILGLILDKEN